MDRALLYDARMRPPARVALPFVVLLILTIVLVFVATPLAHAQDPDPNVNTKYTVAKADVRGVPGRDVSPEIRKEIDALVGKPLDSAAAEAVADALKAAFPEYEVSRRIERSQRKGTLDVLFILSRPDWARYLRYEQLRAKALFHSDQGWGAVLPLTISVNDVLVTPIVTWSNADDYVEENSGFGIRVESRRLGTERLGMMLDWTTQDVDWRDETLAAVALTPQPLPLYRHRMSFTPLMKFAFTPQVSVAGGVEITELDPFEEDSVLPSQMANVAIGSVRYKQHWSPRERVEHWAGASFTLRKGLSDLESDFEYDRYLIEGDYVFRARRHRVRVSALAGRITGSAPLFERFTLGDSHTLRGWDKYDISPVGGDRMFHTSLEYQIKDVMLFVDAGSVWDTGTARRVRFSTGAGFTPGPLFFTLGFPINTDEFRAVFTMGFRWGITLSGARKN